jgi:hypothetical protein
MFLFFNEPNKTSASGNIFLDDGRALEFSLHERLFVGIFQVLESGTQQCEIKIHLQHMDFR